MALDWFSGFDYYATADLTTGVTSRFTSHSGWVISSGAARTGTNGLRAPAAGNSIINTALSNAATRILGFAMRFQNTTTDDGRVFAAFGDGDPTNSSFVQVSLALTSSGKLQVYRGRQLSANSGGTQLGSDSTNVLSSNTWYYVELVVTFHNSAGTVEVFVNNSKTGWIDLTGQDTTNTANAYANSFGFGGRNNSGTNDDYDDVYVVSGTGGIRTSRLGDCRCRAVIASTGDGAVAQFTPSSGSDNGAMVDDTTPNGDTDYNESTSVGDIDTYAFGACGATGTIFGVQGHMQCKKTDASTGDGQVVARIGSTNYLGTQTGLSTTYGHLTTLWEQSPDTSSNWTASEVDGAEFGLKHPA
jgi:hypothetical protein